MPIFKRGTVWYCDFSIKGERIVRSLQTSDKESAQEAHDKLKAELWRQIALGEQPDTRQQTVEGAVSQFIIDAERRGVKDTQTIDIQLRYFMGCVGKRTLISKITADDILDMVRAKIADGARIKKAGTGIKSCEGRREISNATLNRYVAAVVSLLNYAKERSWYAASVPKVKKFPEKGKRIRFLTQEQAAALLSNLSGVVKKMVEFSLLTGLRQKNVTHLEWSQVDVARKVAWIEADQAKGKKKIPIQLSPDAIKVLEHQAGKHPIWVFPNDEGKAYDNPASKHWHAALKASCITDFRWHDLRHTWASWHVQNGTPLPVLQELGGWSKYEMVQKYAHLAPSHIASFAGNVSLTVAVTVAVTVEESVA